MKGRGVSMSVATFLSRENGTSSLSSSYGTGSCCFFGSVCAVSLDLYSAIRSTIPFVDTRVICKWSDWFWVLSQRHKRSLSFCGILCFGWAESRLLAFFFCVSFLVLCFGTRRERQKGFSIQHGKREVFFVFSSNPSQFTFNSTPLPISSNEKTPSQCRVLSSNTTKSGLRNVAHSPDYPMKT